MSSNPESLHPSVIFDRAGRLTVSWLNARSDAHAYELELKDFPHYDWAASTFLIPSLVIDTAVFAPWAPLSATLRPSSSLAIFYPAPDVSTWQSSFFDWAGNESPLPGPAIEVSSPSITIDSRPAIFSWLNGGSSLLVFTWNLSTGFFIQRGPVRLSQGNETLERATGKINMLVSDGSRQTGNLTLLTNDPRHQTVTVSIQGGN
ncbi:MAG: hypothetical protein A3H42_04670 [Deltaproteobacteria bacterium RIFCSPLOWO2_02_FULL_46_8]|nr:MAG: hypothetical protein A3H42_04670 [Deltaproteobacteria bacterium RIFCSPLOWO2_02_FULL_46_8]